MTCGEPQRLVENRLYTFDRTYEYEETINIFNNYPYLITEYETKEESYLISRKLMKWGIDVQTINPIGEIEYIDTDIIGCPICGSTYIHAVSRK